ncbi:hypothetical protein ACOME3_001240 [Neoechinorhynchus agilis]
MTLGMIWTIILRFAIQDISVDERSAKEGLLLWCQRKTANYKNVCVQNFHTSFQDGLAFCALIHRHRPHLVDYDNLSKLRPLENLNLAFDLAEKYLDIPRMLDPEELSSSVRPDEKSVMTYVSCYYHTFTESQRIEHAISCISELVNLSLEKDQQVAKCELDAKSLLKWISSKTIWLNQQPANYDNSSRNSSIGFMVTNDKAHPRENLKKRLAQFQTYRLEEKSKKMKELSELEMKVSDIKDGSQNLIDEISLEWDRMDEAEQSFYKSHLNAYITANAIDRATNRYERKRKAYLKWINGKSEIHLGDMDGLSLERVKELRKRFEMELSSFEMSLSEDRESTLFALNGLKEREKLWEEQDKRWRTYSSVYHQIMAFLDDAEAELEGDLESSIGDFYDIDFSNAKKLYDSACELQNLITTCALNVEPNPYLGDEGHGDLTRRWIRISDELCGELKQKRRRLMEAEESVELLGNHVKRMAQSFTEWIETQIRDITDVSTMSYLRQNEGLDRIKHVENEYARFMHKSASLPKMFDHSVIDRSRRAWYRFCQLVDESLNRAALENGNGKVNGNTEDDYQDIYSTFKHFDRHNMNSLDMKEFRACLIALGFAIDDQEDGLLERVKRDEVGRVTFDAFSDFVRKEVGLNESDEFGKVTQSFRVLAGGAQSISVEQLRNHIKDDRVFEYCRSHMRPQNCSEDSVSFDYETFCYGLVNANRRRRLCD